jgi:2,5-furandicarboxylate decarboxylase 1
LEVAIVVGMEPVTWFSSIIWAPGGHDKLEMAGGLRGEPVELLHCATVDLKIPSTAEVVIEGRILQGVREKDGPCGEVLGCYKTFADNPVIDVSAVMHRKNFIYQDLMPWSKESDMLMEYSYGVEIYKDLKKLLPSIAGFHFLEGTCMLNAAISISKKSEGDVKRALYLALNLNPNIKNIIVVDDDVDIYSITELSWALATRFQSDKDIIIVSDVKGALIDPSSKANTITAKIGIDATKPIGAEEAKFAKVRVSPDAEERASRLLKKYGG